MSGRVQDNTESLETVADFMRGMNARLRVGLFQGQASRPGVLSNPAVGSFHEQPGKTRSKLPRRSFLLDSFKVKKNQTRLIQTIGIADPTRGDAKRVLNRLKVEARRIVDDAFKTRGFGNWTPLSAATIKRKKSSTPLIDTGSLRGAVGVVQLSGKSP